MRQVVKMTVGLGMSVLAIAALALAGCSTDVVDHPVSVSVPVAVPCRITPPPAPPFAMATAKSTMFDQVKALIASNQQHAGYEIALNSAISGCQ